MSNSENINNSFPQPRKEIIKMNSYSAPLENRRELLRLDFNENTIGPSPKVLEAMQKIKLNHISIYPEYAFLKNNLCLKYFDNKVMDINEIGIFNGADAAINAIFNTFGERGDTFLTTNPTFGYYFPCAEMRGMKIIKCSYLGDSFSFPLKEFEEKIITFNPKLIFICNPNNPTGTVLKAEEIMRLANYYKNSLFVIDELYEKFYGDSIMKIIDFEKTKNIVVIQSLSKTAGLAGLRIGFAFGNKKIINFINKVNGPYDINSFAVIATIAALDDKKYIDDYISKVKKARFWIKSKFDTLNVRSHFSGGNYFLLWPKKGSTYLEEKMRSKGILIRAMSNKKNIEKSVRISIGTKEQMILFWNLYKKIDL